MYVKTFRNQHVTNPRKKIIKNGISIGHVNICSLVNKTDELKFLLDTHKFDVLCISETMLSDTISDNEIYIEDYNVYRRDRKGKKGGGVCLYVKSNLSVTLLNDLLSETVEILWVKIHLNCVNMYLKIAVVYRPPNALENYFNALIDNLNKAVCDKNEFVMLGDMNLTHDDPKVKLLCNLFNMSQIILKPTRVTLDSAKIIDHIYTSNNDFHIHSDVLKTSFSDHYTIYTVVKWAKSTYAPKTYKRRNYIKFNEILFLQDISNFTQSFNIHKFSTVENAWQIFKESFLNICNRHAPVRTSKIKPTHKPWITKDIISLIHQRNKLHSLALKLNSRLLFEEYRKMRNLVTLEIRHSKQNFTNHSILTSQGDTAKMWSALKHVMGKSASNKSNSNVLTANQINTFFATVGSKLAEKFTSGISTHIPSSSNFPTSIHTFKFSTINTEEVFKLLTATGTKPKLDILEFDNYLLYLSAAFTAKPLTDIFNMSCVTGHVPHDFKKARVTPIYKNSGSVDECSNYRPISVMCNVAKVFEKCINMQLLKYMKKHAFLSPHQSAFRNNFSTQTSLHRVIDDWLEAIEHKSVTLVCCYDLKKCFDSIDHHILLNKLSMYGIKNIEYSWFKSYLTDRSQATFYQNSLSTFSQVNTGIPQGSILGPLLFLIFINDIVNIPYRCYINLYADDILLYASDDNINCAVTHLQDDINKLSQWFKDNKLTINNDKTFLIPIGSKQRLSSIIKLPNIYIDEYLLPWKNECKYLGVIIDSNLTWHSHINFICSKLRPKLGILTRLRHILSRKELCLIYTTLIQSVIDYGITLWGLLYLNLMYYIHQIHQGG